VQSTADIVQRKLNQEKKDKTDNYVFSLDLNVDSVLDDVTSGGREFHVRDAAAGKARSPIALYSTLCFIKKHPLSCLPRDASAERGDATVSRLSVRLSV